MRKLPPSRRTVDPQLPAGRKRLVPTLITSSLAILITMFAMGQFPQVDAWFTALNKMLQAQNDNILRAMVHLLPAALLAVGALGLSALIVGNVRSRRKSA